MCRVLSQKVGVVRPHLTSLAASLQVCRVCYTRSGWCQHIEPPRTCFSTERARRAKVCHRSAGCFDRTAPPLAASLPRQQGCGPALSTPLQGKQGRQGVFVLVRGGSNTANLSAPSQPTGLQREQGV